MHLGRTVLQGMVGAAVTALAGCGGGLSIGIGGGFGDLPPDVALATAVTDAAPGNVVRLAAAATDDDGIDNVAFYRLDAGGGAMLLGSDGAAPFQWDATVPAAAPGSVERYFARATDTSGQRSDSAVVSVLVR